MTGDAQRMKAEAQPLLIDSALLSWLNGHSDRLAYERLISKRVPVKILPGTEAQGIGGSGEMYVTVRPASGNTTLRVPKRFLKTSAELQEAQRRERQVGWASAGASRAAVRPRPT